MKMVNSRYLLTVIILVIFGFSLANAQTENPIIITWQAYNYYPSDYQGKALATAYSQVLISAELIQNNQFVSLSDASITWYVDNKFFRSGSSLKQMILNASKLAGDTYLIRVVVQKNGNIFENSAVIPVNPPQIIIENSFPSNMITGGRTVSFQAIPYFFSIQRLNDLTFTWRVNDEITPQSNENLISVNVDNPDFDAATNLINLNVSARNQVNPLEFADGNLKLLIKKS